MVAGCIVYGYRARSEIAGVRSRATFDTLARMTVSQTRIASESASIPGPAGLLEALIDTPEAGAGEHVVVVCHPHPLHGGTMTNKVAHMLAKAFNSVGAAAVRFNFRGVGKSAGAYAEGIGETDDALAVMEWAGERWPHAKLSLAGFSFGGAVAIRAAAMRPVYRLVTVAPAVDRVDVPTAVLPTCPWLIVQGDQDDVVDPTKIREWAEGLAQRPELALLSGVGHYFHGRLNELKEVVVNWFQETM